MEIKVLKVQHLDFVPFTDENDSKKHHIAVFTRRKNHKEYKKKKFQIGFIMKIKNTYGFIQASESIGVLGYETLIIIGGMLAALENKEIIFKNGEFIENDRGEK